MIQKLFKGGLVADGTGSALARVDVAIKDGQIVDVGNLDVSADEVIDIKIHGMDGTSKRVIN